MQVDNVIYVVVHNNHWWNWTLGNNATSVLDYFTGEMRLILYKNPQKINQYKNGEQKIKRMIYISFWILHTCFRTTNVSDNLWIIFIQCRTCTNNLNFMIFHWWYFIRMINIISRVWQINILLFCCCHFSWTPLNIIRKNLV